MAQNTYRTCDRTNVIRSLLINAANEDGRDIREYIARGIGSVALKDRFKVLRVFSDAAIQTSITQLRKEYGITDNGPDVKVKVDADNDFVMQDVEEEASVNAPASMHQQPSTPKMFVRTPMRRTPRSMSRGHTPSFGRRGNTPSFGRGGQYDVPLPLVDLTLSDDETGTNGGRSVYSRMNEEVQREVVIMKEKNAKKIIRDVGLDIRILDDVRKDHDTLARAFKAEMKSTNNDSDAVLNESNQYASAAVSRS